MINSEYRLALPWYDNIDKQNRYKSHCAAVCDWKLLMPTNFIPPFQLMTEEFTTQNVVSWYVRCADDDTITVDLTAQIGLIETEFTLANNWYYTYDGTAIDSLSLPCGTYYMELVIDEYTETPPADQVSYYSEVFTVIADIASTTFTQSNFNLWSLWRWYGDIDQQTRNKSECGAICDYYLTCSNTALLPFQFRYFFMLPITYVVTWSLISVEDDCETFLDESLIDVSSVGGINYFTYIGDAIDLPCGRFYSKVVIDGTPYYSELINIIEITDNSTNYILQENNFKILLETGFGLLQE